MGTEALPGAIAIAVIAEAAAADTGALPGISKVATPSRDARHPDTSSAASPTPSPPLEVDTTLTSKGPKGTVAAATAAAARLASPATFVQSDARLHPQDGRIRDPVPSKLKGVNRDLSGNFSVMHMDVNSHPKSKARGAAAQRTSESTALQARLASTPAYVSHHRRANYPKPGVPRHHMDPAPLPSLQVQISPSSVLPAGPTSGHVPRELRSEEELVMLPLTPPEVKSEQARLLTLLRTLPPSTVVDQFCKALAFFGGVPEAPPPLNGRFPDSGEANGQGSLFVGWVSEIFPNLENPRRSVPRPVAPPVERPAADPVAEQAPPLVKRPRGRPKGSKASKVRSDKGIKKGPQSSARKLGTGSVAPVGHHEGITFTRPGENADMTSDDVRSHDGPQSTATVSQALATSGIAGTTVHAGAGPAVTLSRKRGRPKGSKNRPRESLVAVLPVQTQQPADITTSHDQNQGPTAQQSTMSNIPDAVLSVASTKAAITKQKGHQGVPTIEHDSMIQDGRAAEQPHGAGEPSSNEHLPRPGGSPLSQDTRLDASTDGTSHLVAGRPTSHGTDGIMPSSGKRKRPAVLDAALDTVGVANGHIHTSTHQGPLPITTLSLSHDNESPRAALSAPKAKRARRTKVNPWMRDLVGEKPGTGEPGGLSVDRPGVTPTAASVHDSPRASATVGGSRRTLQDRQHLPHDLKSPRSVAGGLKVGLDDLTIEITDASHINRPVRPTPITDQQLNLFPQQNSAAPQVTTEISPRRDDQQSPKQPQQNLAWSQDSDEIPGLPIDAHPPHHASTGHQPPPPPHRQRQRGGDNHSPVDLARRAQTNKPHSIGTGVHRNHQPLQSHAMNYGGHPSLSHTNASHPPHNTQLASSMDQSLYRPNVAGGSPTHGHHTLQTLQPSFGEFQGSHLFDMQGLEHNDGHHGMGLDGAPYNMQLSNGENLRRAERNSGNPSYSTSSEIDSFIAQTGLTPSSHQSRWHS